MTLKFGDELCDELYALLDLAMEDSIGLDYLHALGAFKAKLKTACEGREDDMSKTGMTVEELMRLVSNYGEIVYGGADLDYQKRLTEAFGNVWSAIEDLIAERDAQAKEIEGLRKAVLCSWRTFNSHDVTECYHCLSHYAYDGFKHAPDCIVTRIQEAHRAI